METTERIRSIVGPAYDDQDASSNLYVTMEALNASLRGYLEPGASVEELGLSLDRALDGYLSVSEALADEVIPALAQDVESGDDDASDRLDAVLGLDIKIASVLSQLCAEIEVEQFETVPELTTEIRSEIENETVQREALDFVRLIVGGFERIQVLDPDTEEGPPLITGGAIDTVRGDVRTIVDTTTKDAFVTIKRSATVAGWAAASAFQRVVDRPNEVRAELDTLLDDLREFLGWLGRGVARLWRAAVKKVSALLQNGSAAADFADFAETVQRTADESGATSELTEEINDELKKTLRDRVGARLLGTERVIERCDAAIASGDPKELLGEASDVIRSFKKRRRFVRWGNHSILAMSTAAYSVPPMALPTALAAAVVLAGNYWKAHDHLDADAVGVLTVLPDRNKGLVRALGA